MPNHIRSVLKIHYNGPEDGKMKIQQFLKEVATEESPFDFNTIIPMPPDSETFFNRGEGITRAIEEKYGEENTCLGWARKNWGTKWNAYEVKVVDNGWNALIYFQTAWNTPTPVLEKLFEKYKEYDLTFVNVDEGGWFATFIRKYPDGEGNLEMIWDSKNDPDGIIRDVLDEALNSSY